jgi:AraC-like DNA-binding protein
MHVYPRVFKKIDGPTRLLVAGATQPVDDGRWESLVSDSFVLPRALAYFDFARGVFRAPGGDPVATFVHATDLHIEVPSGAMRWLTAQLAACDDRLDTLARALARTECYQVVRFVLGQHRDKTIAALAKEYGLSDVHFYRLCKQYFGQPLKRQLRVVRAANALLDGPAEVGGFTQLALEHGYASASHFCRDVKALTGSPPTALYDIARRH